MFRILFTLFILIPLLEIYLLIKVGSLIGALPTVFMVVFTAALGALLLRHQGLYTYAKVQTALARGELPTVAMLEGLVLLISGAMLLTPGFFTDTLGFLGLIPPLRQWVILKVIERGIVRTMGPGAQPRHREDEPRTLEGEYRREDDD
ncbi:MAG: FxsA family protein [Pseudomonadota bacterium]